jgi:peptidyl-prolyl cis-trans isomerase A (cyclophilin A)
MKGARKMNFMNKALSVMVILGIMLSVSICFGARANAANPVAVIQTTMGDITVELYRDKAPKSVENFLTYAKSGYYGGTIFHRVIKGFMIQGGGLTEALTPRSGLRAPIINEYANGLKNDIGTIAMARTNEMNSATSQFFINTRNNGGADTNFTYAVFGKVIEVMDIVKKIESSPTVNSGMYSDVPKTTITIKAVQIKSE